MSAARDVCLMVTFEEAELVVALLEDAERDHVFCHTVRDANDQVIASFSPATIRAIALQAQRLRTRLVAAIEKEEAERKRWEAEAAKRAEDAAVREALKGEAVRG